MFYALIVVGFLILWSTSVASLVLSTKNGTRTGWHWILPIGLTLVVMVFGFVAAGKLIFRADKTDEYYNISIRHHPKQGLVAEYTGCALVQEDVSVDDVINGIYAENGIVKSSADKVIVAMVLDEC